MLGIVKNGIVQRQDDGTVTIYRPGKNGGQGEEIEVSHSLADTSRLATGDIVEGETEAIAEKWAATTASDECMEDAVAWDEQWDEPTAARGVGVPSWLVTHAMPTERLTAVKRINGLSLEEAEERPSPRRKRSSSERALPDRLLPLTTGPKDVTGRMLDFAASLGLGEAGIISGPHASGLTRTLRAVLAGAQHNLLQMPTILLLLRARSEEITDWRRHFPNVDVVVCPSAQGEATPEQTLRVADLTMEAALRQTELGRDVLLAVDSLTGLWGTMLEAEGADAQRHADYSQARQRIREWMQRAGNFSGEGPLGGSLGGSLTLVGTVWHQGVDAEAEEENEVHPHLRLMEHILFETSWRVPLSGALARQRLYPAIDTARCVSQREDNLLPADSYDRLLDARRALADLSPLARY